MIKRLKLRLERFYGSRMAPGQQWERGILLWAMRHKAVEDFPSSFSALIIISFPFHVAVLTPSLENLACSSACLCLAAFDHIQQRRKWRMLRFQGIQKQDDSLWRNAEDDGNIRRDPELGCNASVISICHSPQDALMLYHSNYVLKSSI